MVVEVILCRTQRKAYKNLRSGFMLIWTGRQCESFPETDVEIKRIIERELVKENRYEIIKGEMCFKTSTNGYIRLDTIGGDYNCIVIEFAENKRRSYE